MRYFNKIDRSISLAVLFAFVLTIIASCVAPSGPLGAPNNLVSVPSVSSVQITLAKSTLAPGQTTQATVVATSADGKVVTGRVDYLSEKPSVATVSSDGAVTAQAAGETVIQATVASRVALATVTVSPVVPPAAIVAVVAVTLDSTSLAIGHTAKASAVAKDSAGNRINGQTVTWTSLSPTFAAVSSNGTVTAIAAGSATIEGKVSGKVGSASLTVLQSLVSPVSVVAVKIDSTTLLVGHLAHASATPKDAVGNPISGQAVSWASLTPGVVAVSPSGDVRALASGSAIVQATVSGTAGLDTLTVVIPPDLATDSFNSGTLGQYYTNPWGVDVDFPADPTGSGRGKVARIHYLKVTTPDKDRGLGYTHHLGVGETMYFRGEFYLATASLGDGFWGRKLLYWQPNTNFTKYGWGSSGGPSFQLILGLMGTDLFINQVRVDQNGTGHQNQFRIASNMLPNAWYSVEVQTKFETNIGAGDGIIRVWLDGAEIYTNLAVAWTDPNWIGQPLPGGNGTPLEAADVYFRDFLVGQQVNLVNGTFDEYRYWYKVAFSTERIGQ